ncbi:uncharacterized protein LOC127247124 [Andrographis paniculata]|uniref:uncharacterized protein LOC127247124 n=1 Tax=Andrographis paniculata TaxID=175694 RepID=UPI0021E743BA|nr:uncharacterized protein LOC127247124 [Andrographis paniculata]
MASACVNNVGMSTENFLDCSTGKFTSYGWLSPRISFSREVTDEDAFKTSAATKNRSATDNAGNEKLDEPDPEFSGKDYLEFEFRLEDPAIMLPADQLFSDGKLVPLQQSTVRQSMESVPASSDVKSPDTPVFRLRSEISSTETYLFSPKAPRCSSRWKELLGLKKLYQNSSSKQEDLRKESLLSSHGHTHSKNYTSRSLKNFLHRSSKSSLNASNDASISLPLLKDPDSESVSISSRLSLSSSSSGHEHEDLPRLSLDSDRPSSISRNSQTTSNLSRVRVVKRRSALSSENSTAPTRTGRSPIRRASESNVPVRGVSVDSPRMNASGKIVFHSLERSSSSPSTFNGGPRYKHRGMERSYSANVRVTPVLNVPVCSIRGSSKSGVFGFPLFSSPQKKESGGSTHTGNRTHHNHNRSRADRI